MTNINFEVRTDELHRAFKVKCINKNKTMEEQLNNMMERWVNSKSKEFSELDEGELI